MSYPYRGPWCSEVTFVPPDFAIADCQAAAGINIANCSKGGIPVTAVEREALRVDCGDVAGGMDLAHLRKGLDKRYGLTARYLQSLQDIQDALQGGWAVDINGWLDATPRNTWMQHSGNVYHAESFNLGDKPGFVHQANPLAPKGHPGWEQPISVALEFARSSASGRGGIPRGIYALALPERPQSGPALPVEPVSTFEPYDGRFKVPLGTAIYAGPQITPAPISTVQPNESYVGGSLRVVGKTVGWRVCVVNAQTAAWIAADQGTDLPSPPAGDIKHEVTLVVDGNPAFTTKV